ncbi:host cell division inhibitor Icd-like protein, partial [Escherichia coli]
MLKNRLQKIITGLYASCVAHMATGFSSLKS